MSNQVIIKERKTRIITLRVTEFDYQQIVSEAYKRCLSPTQFIMYSLSFYIHTINGCEELPFI